MILDSYIAFWFGNRNGSCREEYLSLPFLEFSFNWIVEKIKEKLITMVVIKVMTVSVDLLQDLISTQDKLTHAEVRSQSLVAEKERLKGNEARLISENEMLHRNQQTRDQLVISLEAIQV